MKSNSLLVAVLVLMLANPLAAGNGKKQLDRGMLEKMDAVACGAKQKGITGLGSLWASAGIEHVTSDEKLCPEYLLRTDDMEYRIRPTDKHPIVLPVGHESEFRVKKDRLYLRMADGDRKMRAYQVVSMKPLETEGSLDMSTDKPAEK